VKELLKSVNIFRNYHKNKVGRFLRHSVLSGDIRFMWIFAGVPWGGASNGASNDSGVVDKSAIF